MPRPTGRRRGQGGSRGQKRSVPRVDFALSDSDEYVPECVSAPEPTRQRSRALRSRRSRRSRNQFNQDHEVHVDLTQADEHESPSLTEASSQNGVVAERGRSQRRGNGAPRAAVISLDVTYSSDDLNEDLSSPERTPERLSGFVLSPSPKKGKSSGSEESDLDIANKEAKSPVEEETSKYEKKESCQYENISDSDVEEDLFLIDYKAQREGALKCALKEIKAFEKEAAKQKKILDNSISAGDVTELSLDGGSSPLKNSIDLDLSLISSDIKLPKRKKRKSKKLKEVHTQIRNFEEEISKNHVDDVFSHDIIIESDIEDEDANPSITLLIRWESTLLRWPVRQYQKFSSVYQEVADRFSLDVAQVLLSYNDKVIKHEACPKDLKLAIGDILEGGVQSQPTHVEKGTVPTARSHSPDSIPLKLQNADRKGSVTIYIKQKAKMIELMHRYAEEKNVKLETLKFSFDGETLDPSDTPESLDLEGNECIDVYTK